MGGRIIELQKNFYMMQKVPLLNWEECFMNVHCVRTYVDHLQERSSLTVGTIAEKIRRLNWCVEYVVFLHKDERIIQRCTRVLQQLTKWRCSLRKIRQQKWETRVKSKAEVAQSFLNSLKVQE